MKTKHERMLARRLNAAAVPLAEQPAASAEQPAGETAEA